MDGYAVIQMALFAYRIGLCCTLRQTSQNLTWGQLRRATWSLLRPVMLPYSEREV